MDHNVLHKIPILLSYSSTHCSHHGSLCPSQNSHLVLNYSTTHSSNHGSQCPSQNSHLAFYSSAHCSHRGSLCPSQNYNLAFSQLHTMLSPWITMSFTKFPFCFLTAPHTALTMDHNVLHKIPILLSHSSTHSSNHGSLCHSQNYNLAFLQLHTLLSPWITMSFTKFSSCFLTAPHTALTMDHNVLHKISILLSHSSTHCSHHGSLCPSQNYNLAFSQLHTRLSPWITMSFTKLQSWFLTAPHTALTIDHYVIHKITILLSYSSTHSSNHGSLCHSQNYNLAFLQLHTLLSPWITMSFTKFPSCFLTAPHTALTMDHNVLHKISILLSHSSTHCSHHGSLCPSQNYNLAFSQLHTRLSPWITMSFTKLQSWFLTAPHTALTMNHYVLHKIPILLSHSSTHCFHHGSLCPSQNYNLAFSQLHTLLSPWITMSFTKLQSYFLTAPHTALTMDLYVLHKITILLSYSSTHCSNHGSLCPSQNSNLAFSQLHTLLSPWITMSLTKLQSCFLTAPHTAFTMDHYVLHKISILLSHSSTHCSHHGSLCPSQNSHLAFSQLHTLLSPWITMSFTKLQSCFLTAPHTALTMDHYVLHKIPILLSHSSAHCSNHGSLCPSPNSSLAFSQLRTLLSP